MFAVDAFDFQRKDAFRDACEESGQFERTLLIADEESYVSYLEGCTVHPLVILCIPLSFWKRLRVMFITVRQAPMFDSKQLHVKLSKYEELDAEVCFRIAPKLGHSSDITTRDSLLVRQL